ncbi:MAG: hypothetical protein VX868_05195, partial [Chloroflexota bacterium]|nr:hypothetical protein [Chloroflexota bacterium]
EVPDVFYLKDKAGDDKLHATTFFNAFLPKVPTSSKVGGDGEQALNMVTFDADGTVVPTIVQYDPLGNPVGTIPMTDEFTDPNGDTLEPPKLPILEYNSDGSVGSQKQMPLLVRDAEGGVREFNVPPPIVFGEDGKPLGMSEPPKLMIGDTGVAGFEAGKVLSKDFYADQSRFIRDSFSDKVDAAAADPNQKTDAMGISGLGSAPLGFVPSGAMDKLSKYGGGGGPLTGTPRPGPGGGLGPMATLADFDKYDLSSKMDTFYDAGGAQKTGHEFRMQEVHRDANTGEVAGFQPISEVMCMTQDCFRDASQNDSVLASLEEKVQILSKDADGKSVIAEIGGQTLFTEDGQMAGFIPPPIVMGGGGMMGGPGPMGPGGAGSAVSFAKTDMMFFGKMDMPARGPEMASRPGPNLGPATGPPGAPAAFGIDFEQGMGDMTFMTRASRNDKFGPMTRPGMTGGGAAGPMAGTGPASSGPGAMTPAAGPMMEFSLNLTDMFGPSMPAAPPTGADRGGPAAFIDPTAGLGGFAAKGNFTQPAGMADLFTPTFGGYLGTAGQVEPPAGSGTGPMTGTGPASTFAGFGPMKSTNSFGKADDFIATDLAAEDIGGDFFQNLNDFEDARKVTETAAFNNRASNVQAAYDDALGIKREVYAAPPSTFGAGGAGAMAAGTTGARPGGATAAGPMTGTGPASSGPMPNMGSFGFADPFAATNAPPQDAFSAPMMNDGTFGAPAAVPMPGMFDNLVNAASADIVDRGVEFGPATFDSNMTKMPPPAGTTGGAGAAPGTTGGTTGRTAGGAAGPNLAPASGPPASSGPGANMPAGGGAMMAPPGGMAGGSMTAPPGGMAGGSMTAPPGGMAGGSMMAPPGGMAGGSMTAPPGGMAGGSMMAPPGGAGGSAGPMAGGAPGTAGGSAPIMPSMEGVGTPGSAGYMNEMMGPAAGGAQGPGTGPATGGALYPD